ncbi:MAG: hypothetical protein IH626_02725 [Rhodospirillales bacterium]|nr:hypothetical protein [Rhodospirillales bacterium]
MPITSVSAFTRLSVFAGWTMALAGCSTADYAQPINTFAEATTAAESALIQLDRMATDEYTAFLSQRARTDLSLAVIADSGECEIGSERCRIVIVDPNNRARNQAFPPDPLLGNMVVLMGGARAYAQNLAALVADDTAAKAEAHVNAALGSIETLANTVDTLDKKGAKTIPSFATPAGAAVNWVLGQYVERIKLAGLKRATAEADPVIARMAALFRQAAVFGSDLQREQLTQRFQTRIDAYQDQRASEANLNAAVDAARTYDAFLQTQPGETFLGLAESHAALTGALHNADASWPQAIGKIRKFAAEAQRLAKIVQDLAPLLEKK